MDIPQFNVHAALEEKHWWFTSRRLLLMQLLKKLVPNNGSIVDVGCGTGANTAAIAKSFSCIGIDPIPEAIESAMSRFPDATFRTGYAPKDCPEIHTADAVLLLDVLEHIEDDFLLVSELLSAMKPNAYLIMMAPANIRLWSVHNKGFDHFRRYSEARFRNLWEGLPVQEILLTHWNSTLYWPIRIVRWISRICKKSMGAANTDLALPPQIINALLYNIVLRENARILSNRYYHHGVSILAVIQKTDKDVIPHTRPNNIPIDATPWKTI